MNIFIITRDRIGKQVTYKSIPREWLDRTYLVCRDSEFAGHRKHHPDVQLIKQPKKIENYSQKFQWVMDTGCRLPDPKFVILDDDLVFSKRMLGTAKLTKMHVEEDFADMWNQFDALLNDYALASIHPRQMGHIQKLPHVENGKVIRVQGINLDLLPGGIKVDQHPILADMVLNCELLSRGRANALLTTYVQDQIAGQAPGGCSLYRDAAMQEAAVRFVADRYGPWAKAVWKEPKQAKWLGDGWWDLRVQWKQLYKDRPNAR